MGIDMLPEILERSSHGVFNPSADNEQAFSEAWVLSPGGRLQPE